MSIRNGRTTATVVTIILTLAIFIIAFTTYPSAKAQQTPDQPIAKPDVNELRAGYSFIQSKMYTEKDNQELLKLFDGLRVADVSDGMDKVGLANIGLMDPEIHASWKDTEHYAHRFIGIAVTARYVPTNKPTAGGMEKEAFDKWVGWWYSELSSEPFVPLIRKGHSTGSG